MKPFEAFATGRTVVLSDVRALASIAAESGAAELFRAGDPDSLASVLLALLRNPDRRRNSPRPVRPGSGPSAPGRRTRGST